MNLWISGIPALVRIISLVVWSLVIQLLSRSVLGRSVVSRSVVSRSVVASSHVHTIYTCNAHKKLLENVKLAGFFTVILANVK